MRLGHMRRVPRRGDGGSMIANAAALAELAHRGQVRKYGGEPYITHPLAVARMASGLAFPEPLVAAALLHDVAEDATGDVRTHAFEMIASETSSYVAVLVWWLTNLKRPGTRKQRKAMDLERLAKAPSDALAIKCLDRAHNLKSLIGHSEGEWFLDTTYLDESIALYNVITIAHIEAGRPIYLTDAREVLFGTINEVGRCYRILT